MELMLVSFSFEKGGAGLAACKFVRLAREFSAVRCISAEREWLDNVALDNPSRMGYGLHYLKRIVSFALLKLMRDRNPAKHSLNIFSATNVLAALRDPGPDTVVNLHWINNDTLSIWRFGELPKNTVITLHDEWFFRGAEHIDGFETDYEKFVDGYPARDPSIKGFNWNRRIWKIKREQIDARDDLIFTVPSRWMLDRAKRSMILRSKDVRLLPNPVETECFCPLNSTQRAAVRAAVGINSADLVLAVGAVKGEKNLLKGFDLLREALLILKELIEPALLESVSLILFGGGKRSAESRFGFRAVNLGRVNGTKGMRNIYGMADCVVVPSLVESFGQVAAESLACETPVVAFRTSGLVDIVQHEVGGYLAEPYLVESLAESIARVLRLSEADRARLGRAGRDYVVSRFSIPVVSKAYKAILEDALAAKELVRAS